MLADPSRARATSQPSPLAGARALAALIVLASGGLTACDTAPPPPEEGLADPAQVQYAPELDVDPAAMQRTASGLYLRDLEEGPGELAAAGDVVLVHYTGWLPDGRQFDSSRDRAQPFAFQLGTGSVIPGWEQGVEGMREGGRRQLVIPPELAYGASGAGGVISPHATLVFDIELLEVQ